MVHLPCNINSFLKSIYDYKIKTLVIKLGLIESLLTHYLFIENNCNPETKLICSVPMPFLLNLVGFPSLAVVVLTPLSLN